MTFRIPLVPSARLRRAGVIAGPLAFISAWAVSGAMTRGYSPVRDHISDLAAVDAHTRPLMNLGFAAFAVAVGAAASPMQRLVGTPAAVALGANAALSVGIALAPLGASRAGDRAHAVVAGLGYIALAATAPLAAPTLARRSVPIAAASLGVGAVSLACLIASLAAKGQSGFWQRAGITVTDVWMIGVGMLARTGSEEG